MYQCIYHKQLVPRDRYVPFDAQMLPDKEWHMGMAA
jgi:hypothetical protein